MARSRGVSSWSVGAICSGALVVVGAGATLGCGGRAIATLDRGSGATSGIDDGGGALPDASAGSSDDVVPASSPYGYLRIGKLGDQVEIHAVLSATPLDPEAFACAKVAAEGSCELRDCSSGPPSAVGMSAGEITFGVKLGNEVLRLRPRPDDNSCGYVGTPVFSAGQSLFALNVDQMSDFGTFDAAAYGPMDVHADAPSSPTPSDVDLPVAWSPVAAAPYTFVSPVIRLNGLALTCYFPAGGSRGTISKLLLAPFSQTVATWSMVTIFRRQIAATHTITGGTSYLPFDFEVASQQEPISVSFR